MKDFFKKLWDGFPGKLFRAVVIAPLIIVAAIVLIDLFEYALFGTMGVGNFIQNTLYLPVRLLNAWNDILDLIKEYITS